MTNTQQAVVDTADVQGQPDTESVNAQDELDTFLGEYETQTEPESVTMTNSAEVSKIDEVHAMLQQTQQKEVDRVTSERIADSVKMFKEEAGPGLSDEMAEIILQGRAVKDPRIKDAFLNAEANPGAWNNLVKKLGKAYSEQSKSMPDTDATATQNDVVAAVQSASTTAPTGGAEVSDEQILNMSSADFNKLQMKMGVNP